MMKVFTSIFVVDGVRTTFDDMELCVRCEQEPSEVRERADAIRRQLVELQTGTGRKFGRQERDQA